ncbi:MAG TPA: hypothetical protein VHE60_02850 [Pyrinomonadaceae bacterium]|nr:hypothetical protein [Pyrinomonadaceae bacterium]
MNRITVPATFIFLLAVSVAAAAQPQHQTQPTTTTTPTTQEQASRNATREKLRTLLDATGPKINIAFKQSEKQPYNFVGIMSTGLTNADSFEIVISVSGQDTIHFRIYPHYKGAYLNVDKVRDSAGLMRQMVRFSDKNFLYWGADDTFDIFAGYNFTLESGFPDASIRVVLNSVAKLDQFIGEMKSSID